jgi:hypothetical protein
MSPLQRQVVKQALKKLKNSLKDVVAFPRMRRAANPSQDRHTNPTLEQANLCRQSGRFRPNSGRIDECCTYAREAAPPFVLQALTAQRGRAKGLPCPNEKKAPQEDRYGRVLVPQRIVERLQGPLLELDVTEIVMHEADEPDAFVDLLLSEHSCRLATRVRRCDPDVGRFIPKAS